MGRSRWHRMGFTLIELMLVVAIIGLLAAIAIPKFANLVIKAKEAAVRGGLGAIRSAVSIYYADNEGRHLGPAADPMTALTINGKYLNESPYAIIPTVPSHQSGNGATFDNTPATYLDLSAFSWIFMYSPSGSYQGLVIPACTHSDSRGTLWTTQ